MATSDTEAPAPAAEPKPPKAKKGHVLVQLREGDPTEMTTARAEALAAEGHTAATAALS
jgi:hypothetical protein